MTADDILKAIKDEVQSKRMLNPDLWLRAAHNLEVLIGDETTKLEDMRLAVAKKRLAMLAGQEKPNVAATRVRIEADDDYAAMKKQEHKCKQIEEYVRIAKLNARSAGNF